MDRGVLYIAFNENFLKEALISAESVKKHCPDMNITIYSDIEVSSKYVDNYAKISPKHIRSKVDFIHTTPYEKTIFLDSDTIIDHDISEMFDILEKYDMAICHDLARKRKYVSEQIPEYSKIPYVFSEVNPGVVVFKKNERVMKFFEDWRKLFYKYFSRNPYEQPTFRTALWHSDVKLYIMPVEFNIRSKANRQKQVKNKYRFGEEHLKPRIYHMHADTRINQGIYEVSSVDEALQFCQKNYMEY